MPYKTLTLNVPFYIEKPAIVGVKTIIWFGLPTFWVEFSVMPAQDGYFAGTIQALQPLMSAQGAALFNGARAASVEEVLDTLALLAHVWPLGDEATALRSDSRLLSARYTRPTPVGLNLAKAKILSKSHEKLPTLEFRTVQ